MQAFLFYFKDRKKFSKKYWQKEIKNIKYYQTGVLLNQGGSKMKNEVITYSVNKTNDKELYISVQNGEVLVRAPWYVTRERIQRAVSNKKSWIMKKLK